MLTKGYHFPTRIKTSFARIYWIRRCSAMNENVSKNEIQAVISCIISGICNELVNRRLITADEAEAMEDDG